MQCIQLIHHNAPTLLRPQLWFAVASITDKLQKLLIAHQILGTLKLWYSTCRED